MSLGYHPAMSALETQSAASAIQCAATNTHLNGNKDEEITTMATSTNTNSSESDRTSGSIASTKEHSAMPVYDTAAFDNLRVLMELLNDDNDKDECTTWSSIVGANHLVRLRNCDISVQEGTATLQPEPVPIYDVNRSQSLRSSVSLSDLSEMDFGVKSAVSGEDKFTTEMEKQPVDNGGKSTDAEQLLPTTLPLRSEVEETVCLHERGNSRPEVISTDEVDGDTRTRPPLIKEKSLEFLFEYMVTLRAHGRFSKKSLYARPNRLLQMVTIPGSSLPSEFMFKRRVYSHKVYEGMVCSFLSVKHSAFIQVTEDKKVMIGEVQPLDGYPKPSARFSMSKDFVDHISPVTVTNPKMYVDYNRKTDDVILSEDAKAGFLTVPI